MECFIGEIRLFAGTFTPQNWAPCDGGLMAIAEHQALFSIVGTQYGGDGRTTFGRPKMDAPPSGTEATLRYILCINGIYPMRD